MRSLRRRGFLGPAAALVAAIFFVAQVAACCQANARIGRGLASLFSRTAPSAHACCAKANPVRPPGGQNTDCARNCCIQGASQHAPQLASVPSEAPVLSGPSAPLAPAAEPSVARGEWPPAPVDSGPPVYLRTLRLLV